MENKMEEFKMPEIIKKETEQETFLYPKELIEYKSEKISEIVEIQKNLNVLYGEYNSIQSEINNIYEKEEDYRLLTVALQEKEKQLKEAFDKIHNQEEQLTLKRNEYNKYLKEYFERLVERN